MTIKVCVPRDATALSLGADATARAIAAECQRLRQPVQVVRTSSRGLFWLEPFVEVETPQGRVGYGPVEAEDVPGLFAAGFLQGSAHQLAQGNVDAIPFLARQERLCFARAGLTDPLSLAEYEAHRGLRGLRNALGMSPAAVVEEVVDSGLRGRGGAGFPTGIKWRTVAGALGTPKYVVVNADEGDSGTYSDRMVMEGDPFVLLEGMAIAGYATGASYGYVYLRSEYPHAARVLNQAIATLRAADWYGASIQGSGFAFDAEVRIGAGAYICGEETALLESLEGKRGMIRYKPPLPAIKGLFGQPTVVNNVVSLASVPIILDRGGKYYADFGMGRSRGTLPIQLAGNVKRAGLVEKAFGVTLRELIEDYGGGTRSGRPVRAVQVGGPLGAYFDQSLLDLPLDYEALAAKKGMVGHGGIVVFDDTVDMAEQARYAMEFCAVESCGKCTPCRIGSTRGKELIEKIVRGENVARNHRQLLALCDVMENASLCALGGMAPWPVLSALQYFPGDFGLPAGKEPAHVV
ncbi:MAG TPA: NADH-quinone oxidoreductase subunit NuoF [Planctomycetota bacterium]|nr:NADH-quinone oxidoreductase subunit NuoF [Planctomycetota bacterium]